MSERLDWFWGSFYDAAWVIQVVVIALCWVLLCRGIAWNQKTWLRSATEALLLAVLMAVLDIAVVLIPDYPFPLAWNINHSVVGGVYFIVTSACHREAKIMIGCSMFVGMWSLTALAGLVGWVAIEATGLETVKSAVHYGAHIMMFLYTLFLRKLDFDEYPTIPNGGLLLVVAGNLFLLILGFVELPWVAADYPMVIVLTVANVCMLLLLMLVIYAIHDMCKDKAEILALQAEKQRQDSGQELVRLTETNLEDLRHIRHDLKNHYAYLRLLLQQEKYAEMDAHISQQLENIPMPVDYIDCGNRIIGNVLNMELTKAKHADIPVEHHLVVPPELPFTDDDMCAILANLMDNAIEECTRLRAGGNENASIEISILLRGCYLYIVCRNDTDRKKLGRVRNALKTTKGDSQLHGHGTRIVAKLAEKYNGSVDYSLEDGTFVARVMMDMMGEETP